MSLASCRNLNISTDSADEPKIEIEPDFREMHFGRFDGKSFDGLLHERDALDAFWKCPVDNPLPDAETLEQAYERVTKAWERWQLLLDQDTLIVTHGGTIRMILNHALGMDWQNPRLYTNLSIGYQSVSHLQLFKSPTISVWVKSIGSLLG